MKIKINPDLDKLVPKLSEEDDAALDKSIKENGQWLGYPLTVAPDGDIVDGMNRYKKFLKYKIGANYVVDKNLVTFEQKKVFVIQNVLARRHLNNWQKGLLGIELLDTLQVKEGKKSEAIAELVPGLHSRTFEKVVKIKQEASDSMMKKLDSGSLSVNSAYHIVTRKTRNLPKIPMPVGQFDVIYCDVPIKFDDQGGRGAAERHYPTMSAAELMREKIPAAKNAIIFFWIPSAFLVDGTATEILRSWHFEPVGNIVWIKDRIGVGSWVRNQHETLIMAVKGKMPIPAKLFSSVVHAERQEHSKKPDIFYTMIEEMYPKRSYIELFARDARPGWQSHGNQVKETFSEFVKKETEKKPKPKKDVTLACSDCLAIFHSKEDLKSHKPVCPKAKSKKVDSGKSLSAIEKLRSLKK